jgi:hypothetical protein
LKKADLLTVAHYLIGHLSYSQVPALAKRHKVEAKKDSTSASDLLAKQVGSYDESELCKLLLEISLLDQKDGFTMLEARGKYGPWCSIQIEAAGGYCRPEESGVFVETNQWTFEFEPDLNPLGYNLPNGRRIPLPPRGRLWPKRSTTAKFGRAINENQSVIYTVILTPPARDSTAIRKWLIGQAAESGLSKVGAFMFHGLVGPVLAGVATIFVPGDIAHEIPWGARCVEGPVYGVTVGF